MRSSRVNKPGWEATVFGTKKKFLVFRLFQLLTYCNNFLECTIFLTCSYRDSRSDFVVGRIRILFDKTKSFPRMMCSLFVAATVEFGGYHKGEKILREKSIGMGENAGSQEWVDRNFFGRQ